MAKGTLIAAMNIGQVAEDEFQDWYDTEHLPERQRVPGFLTCERWIGAEDRQVSVATYDLDTLGVLQTPAYLAIGGENLSPWSKRVTAKVERLMRFEGDQILPGDQLAPGAGRRAPAQRDEHRAGARGRVQRVVRQGAHPGARGRPRRALRPALPRHQRQPQVRGALQPGHPDVVESAEWKQARQSDWTTRLQPSFKDHLRLVLRRYVRGA